MPRSPHSMLVFLGARCPIFRVSTIFHSSIRCWQKKGSRQSNEHESSKCNPGGSPSGSSHKGARECVSRETRFLGNHVSGAPGLRGGCPESRTGCNLAQLQDDLGGAFTGARQNQS